MHPTDGSGNPIDALLADAQILADYDRSQAPTAAERIARAAARNRPDLIVCHDTHPDRTVQARRKLDWISVQVLNTPQAAASLTSLTSLTSLSQRGGTRQIEPEGALVFACLLHLVGRKGGAYSWWKFAAGSGSCIAARCLALHHQRDANLNDAVVWREEAQRLEEDERLSARQAERDADPAPSQHPLLPDHVAKQLREQCRRGIQPRLPAELEEAVNRLVDEDGDADLGDFPKPLPELPHVLGAHR